MNNNDILTRLRYALDIKDRDMVEVFRLGGVETTKDQVIKLMDKKKDDSEEEFSENTYVEECSNQMLDSFLNGLIISQRGKQENKPAQATQPASEMEHMNNLLLKKVKIALSLTSEDVLEILDEVGVKISKSELSAVLRKEGHRNFKVCGDRYARNLLKGLALRYR
ncbi:DUF1456 family protein [Jeotgalibaca sp. MA1X17-3]|uniref:DUF1456 family protein n=1 Tax=Jeotgalibaca sp. MA1X17-3 TaxID=2908211 RepID=UPI001F490773|nr:DUF1456 family protein [Jeotgalibaca sp. MA1X17-3]UJF16094.1 DUF1456 family protein [Jeotgalibaca sp. MA1X17-3]